MNANDLFKLDHSAGFLKLLPADDGAADMWKWFVAILEHPRTSYHTEEFRMWVADCGKKLGGDVKTDDAGNIIIVFPASPGKENVPGVVLQGHTDMVGTRAETSTHDFLKDPILLRRDGDWIKAQGTTLGADNGFGVAVGFAAAEDKSITHGPLALLFTNDEEVGLEGASNLKPGFIPEQFRFLVNVDSEEWEKICVSCAGAAQRTMSFDYTRKAVPAGWTSIHATLINLVGGHTGVQINDIRGNAILWLAKAILFNAAAIQNTEFRVIAFDGGHAHNAIPSKATAIVAVPDDKVDVFIAAMGSVLDIHIEKFKYVEDMPPTYTIKKEPVGDALAVPYEMSKNMLYLLEQLHHGVVGWSVDVPDLVETSMSVSVVKLVENTFNIEVFLRSSRDEKSAKLVKVLEAFAELHDGTIKVVGTDMPGWPAKMDCKLLTEAKRSYKSLFGQDPPTYAIHAGLECGIIIGIKPDMEAISIGPDLTGPHTIEESLHVASSAACYKLTKDLLEKLAQ